MYVKKNNLTNLTKARQAVGMTRQELAEKSGVSPRTIENFEQKRSSINGAAICKVRAMAQALGVPIESILDDE